MRVEALDDRTLAAEIVSLNLRLGRDRKDYPVLWWSIGTADRARLAECHAERKRRKAGGSGDGPLA